MTTTHESITLRVLRSGRIAEVDSTGRATLATCPWLVEVATASLYPPEAEWYPDFPSDVWTTVECGAPTFAVDGDAELGWYCSNGHHHYTLGSPRFMAEQAGEALMEATARHDSRLAHLLDTDPAEARRQFMGSI